MSATCSSRSGAPAGSPGERPAEGETGVGSLTAPAFVTCLEDPHRFENSRTVGAYLGLCPRIDQSSRTNSELSISKAGNPYVRRLLVTAAQRTIGPFGKDSDLCSWGLKLAGDGKSSKKRAVVAVARKLATGNTVAGGLADDAYRRPLGNNLSRLWVSASFYHSWYDLPLRSHFFSAAE